MNKGLHTATSLALITLLGACSTETVESENIGTDAIWAGIDIVSEDGLSSDINVEFNVGGRNGTNLSLSSGDSVRVSSSTGSSTLQRDTDFLDVDYEGNINTGATNELVEIQFNRSDGTSHTSSVRLPTVFNVSFPQEGIAFTELRDFEILWSDNVESGQMRITQSASCPDGQGNSSSLSDSELVTDDGSYTSTFLNNLSETITDEGCTLTVILTRTNTGTLASGFEEGGYIEGRQERKVENIRVTRS